MKYLIKYTAVALLVLTTATTAYAGEGKGDNSERQAIRAALKEVRAQNKADIQAVRQQCRSRVETALADHPEKLAKIKQRWAERDAKRAERQAERQQNRQDRKAERKSKKAQ